MFESNNSVKKVIHIIIKKNNKIITNRLALLLIGVMLVCILPGCSKNSEEKSAGKKNNAEYELHEEPSGDHYIGFCILMSKYQVFIPNDFKTDYENGCLYEEGINYWTELNYKQAEANLKKLLQEIEDSGTKKPDDKAFVEETLGCLYIEMAKYSEAYDLLMDALVTLKELYGENAYYPNTVSVDLCHYYYAIGDYDGCLKEIQRLRDNFATENNFTDANKDLKYFIQLTLTDLEADIDIDRGKYTDAYNLCTENLDSCQKLVDEVGENTLSAALLINTLSSLGDVSRIMIAKEKFFELSEASYDKALEICNYYKDSDYGKALQSKVLIKKGYLYIRANNNKDEAGECFKKAESIQESLHSADASYPGLVETYRAYAEYFGFIMDDEVAADEYYNKSIDLCSEVFGDNHPELAKTYESMGRYYGNKRREDDKAMEYFDKGIDVYKNLLIENNPLVANMYMQKAGCYKLNGDNSSSDECLKKAYKIYGELGIKVLQSDESWK